MPRLKEPYIATMDQVKIDRQGESATIDYVEPGIGGVSLERGEKSDFFSDEDILEIHNACLRGQHSMRLNHEYICYEIPPGKPQIKFSTQCHQWSPRGGIVRAFIDDGGDYYKGYRIPTIEIDGKELSWAEFGSLVGTYAGWGMRLTFVPDDETNHEPTIIVKEPTEGDRGFVEIPFQGATHE